MDIETVDDLNDLLRDEFSAIETYRKAIDKLRARHGQDARFMQLSRIMDDHVQAADQLRDLVERLGGQAVHDAGSWGTWANTVIGAANLLGDKTALRALKDGEETGIKDYRSTLRNPMTPEITALCASIRSREEEHVRELDRMIRAA